MPTYRLYVMKGPNQHVDSYKEFEAVDERAAKAVAEDVRRDRPMELWSDGRKIACYDPPLHARSSLIRTQV